MKHKAMVTLFFMLLFMICAPVYSAIPPTEREALIALYNSTNGDNWEHNSGWKGGTLEPDGFGPTGSEGSWYGITVSGDHVIEISLNDNNLDGPIPAKLGNLSNLRRLDLEYNRLTGSIPPELGKLSKLERLSLSSNQLSGGIPPELGKLSKLERLFLSSNQLSGNIPPELDKLSKLWELSLSSNQLSGNIPPELGNLSELKWFFLYSNQLKGSIPPELGNLSNLERFFLSSNKLSGSIPPELGNLSKLWELSLYFNQLSGNIPSELGNLSSLQYLGLHSNQLKGSIPRQLGKLSKLKYLEINSNQLSGRIPLELKDLSNLQDGQSDFRWNALYTDDKTLKDFLEKKQYGEVWENTQTIAPTEVEVNKIFSDSVEVKWIPIAYSFDTGGYRVFYSQTPGGPYTHFDTTKAKHDYFLEVTGLAPLTTYYFVVQTRTERHDNNDNTVDSEYSEEVSTGTPGSPKTIWGYVTDRDTGEPVEKVTLTFSPPNEFEETRINGYYRHTVKYGWSGRVTPSKTGYTFDRPYKDFNKVTEDRTQNFTASRIPLAISGYVTSWGKGKDGEGIIGVTLTFTSTSGETEKEITESDGSYSHEVPYGWTGTVTPSKGDLIFYPSLEDYESDPVKGRRDKNYRLVVSLQLEAERKTDEIVIIKKDYVEITLNVSIVKEDIPTPTIGKFVIIRLAPDGSENEIELEVLEQKSEYEFSALDKYLDKAKTYIYFAKALDAEGKVIGESVKKSKEPIR